MRRWISEGTVVEVALDAAPLGVRRGDQALQQRLQLGEPGVGPGSSIGAPWTSTNPLSGPA